MLLASREVEIAKKALVMPALLSRLTPIPSLPVPPTTLRQVEVDADDIAIGEIIGSGSFAEVRRGRLKGGVEDSYGVTSANKTGVTASRRAGMRGSLGPTTGAGGTAEVAVKVLRDVSRQTLKRFWFEVLIMKVG